MRLASLQIHKEEFSFSAGHFTIFSATDRESIHGHNYSVSVVFDFLVGENGLSFDYRHYKKKIIALCNKLDRRFLLPIHSPYLKIFDTSDYWEIIFNHKKLSFLKEDVVPLPIVNSTIEELSQWFLNQLLIEKNDLIDHAIQKLSVFVYNGPGQSGGTIWEKESSYAK